MLYPSRTARLALRAWREEDQPAFAAMNADERVMEYFPATLTAEESADLLDRIRDEFSTEGFGPYAVERLSDGELLGFTGLHRVTFSGGLEGQVEILWRLRHDAWGQGYATEAARACIAHAAKLGIPELVVRRKRAFPARDAEARHDVRRRVRPPRPARGASPAQARPLSHPDRTMKKSATCQRSRTSPFRLRNHFNSNSTVPRISSDAAPT